MTPYARFASSHATAVSTPAFLLPSQMPIPGKPCHAAHATRRQHHAAAAAFYLGAPVCAFNERVALTASRLSAARRQLITPVAAHCSQNVMAVAWAQTFGF